MKKSDCIIPLGVALLSLAAAGIASLVMLVITAMAIYGGLD